MIRAALLLSLVVLGLVSVPVPASVAVAPMAGDSGLLNIVSAIAYSKDGSQVVVGGLLRALSGGILQLYDARTLSLNAEITLPGFSDLVSDVVLSPSGAKLYAGTDGGDVIRFDAATGSLESRIHVGGWVRALEISPDGSRLYVAAGSPSIAVLDTSTEQLVAQVPMLDVAWTLAISPDGSRLFAGYGGHDGLGIVDARNLSFIGSVPLVGGSLHQGDRRASSIAVGGSGTRVFVTINGELVVVDAASGAIVGTKAGSFRTVVASPDDRYLYLNQDGGLVDELDQTTLEMQHQRFIADSVNRLAMRPSGGQMWVGSDSSTWVVATPFTSSVGRESFVPTVVRSAHASLRGDSITVTWKAPSRGGATSYMVSDAKTGGYRCVSQKNSCTFPIVRSVGRWQFTVEAYNLRGSSPSVRTNVVKVTQPRKPTPSHSTAAPTYTPPPPPPVKPPQFLS